MIFLIVSLSFFCSFGFLPFGIVACTALLVPLWLPLGRVVCSYLSCRKGKTRLSVSTLRTQIIFAIATAVSLCIPPDWIVMGYVEGALIWVAYVIAFWLTKARFDTVYETPADRSAHNRLALLGLLPPLILIVMHRELWRQVEQVFR